MLDSLVQRHEGADIAVIGASPTAAGFAGREDVSIAVNGAARLGPRFDYYMCADPRATDQAWFHLDCAETRVMAVNVASMDYLLYPEGSLRMRESLPWDRQHELALPQPKPPHLIYCLGQLSDGALQQLLERDTDHLLMGGTIACQAIQLAYLMGAKSVHLYGCSFSLATSGGPNHYFFPQDGHATGELRADQLRVMNFVLARIRAHSVEVVVHGPSAISEFDRRIA